MQGPFGHTEASMDIQRYSDVSELQSTLVVFVDFPHWDYKTPYLCIERASPSLHRESFQKGFSDTLWCE